MTSRVNPGMVEGIGPANDFAQDVGTTSGLTFGHVGGAAALDEAVRSVPAGTVALANNAVNVVEVDPSPLSTAVTATTGALNPARIPIYRVTTSGGQITAVEDLRSFLRVSTSPNTPGFDFSVASATALNLSLRAGKTRTGGASLRTHPATVVALTNNAVNFVQANPLALSGGPAANTAGWTPGQLPLYRVTTSGGAITLIEDMRTGGSADVQADVLGPYAPLHSGLNYGHSGGPLVNTFGTPLDVSRGTVALTNNATNYVEANLNATAAGSVVRARTGGFTQAPGYYPMQVVVTSGGAITSVTDRRFQAAQTMPLSENPAAHFLWDRDASSGLTFAFRAGALRGDAVVRWVPAGSVVLPNANGLNYVEGDPVPGSAPWVYAVSGGFTSQRVPIYVVTTVGGAITSVQDARTALVQTSAQTTRVNYPVELSAACSGRPAAGELLMQYAPTQSFTLPAGLSASQAFCSTPATLSAVFSLRVNGVEVGTVTFAPGSFTGAMAAAADVVVSPSAIVTLLAPVSPDSTLADLTFSFLEKGGGVATTVGSPAEVSGGVAGRPGASENVLNYAPTRAISFPANMGLSRAVAATPPASDTTFLVLKGGVQVATLTFQAGNAVGQFGVSSSWSLLPGEQVLVQAPASQDTNLADVSVSLYGNFSS